MDMSAKKTGHDLLESEVDKVQGKLTPYSPFEYLYCPYDQDDEEYFLAAHNGTQVNTLHPKHKHIYTEKHLTPPPTSHPKAYTRTHTHIWLLAHIY